MTARFHPPTNNKRLDPLIPLSRLLADEPLKHPVAEEIGEWARNARSWLCEKLNFYYASYDGLVRCLSVNQAASEETNVAIQTAVGQYPQAFQEPLKEALTPRPASVVGSTLRTTDSYPHFPPLSNGFLISPLAFL
jgi:hypothetical protein